MIKKVLVLWLMVATASHGMVASSDSADWQKLIDAKEKRVAELRSKFAVGEIDAREVSILQKQIILLKDCATLKKYECHYEY